VARIKLEFRIPLLSSSEMSTAQR